MQVPIHIGQTGVFLDDARHGPLRQPGPQMVEKHGLPVAASPGFVQDPPAQRLIAFERALGFAAIRDNPLLIAFAERAA